jgi:hypothetical protein
VVGGERKMAENNYWKSHPREMLPLKVASFSYALDELKRGVQEEGGDNRGEDVEKYLAAAELSPGLPWCAAFVNWCAEKAARHKNVISPLESITYQGYVQSYYDHAASNEWLIDANQAEIGDLFMLYYPIKSRWAHIGFVKFVDLEEGTFTTIEGNTNEGGSREGYMVASRTRRISENTCFADWTK